MEILDLSQFFHTKKQASDFSARLSDFSELIYKTDFNLEESLVDKIGLEKKEKFMILLRDNNISISSQSTLKEFLEKLQKDIAKLPVLSLTLAFEPNQETLNYISEWFMLNLKKQFIFDINVNPSLIAGVIVNYNGKFKDYSIKPKFDKLVSDVMASGAKLTPPLQHQTAKTIV